MDGLKKLQKSHPVMMDIRGLGLMVGAEFRSADNTPDKATAKAVTHACLEHGLMLLTCGPWDNTIRFMPPLVVTEEQVNEALSILELSLKESIK